MRFPYLRGASPAAARLLFPLLFFYSGAQAQEAASAPPANPAALIGAPYAAPESTGDKSNYTLFDPVPDDQMRPFSTDRPGKSHNTSTVDAGHYQIESNILSETFDRNSPGRQTTRSLGIGMPVLKAGVTDNIDLEAAFAFYNDTHVKDRTTGASIAGSGFGDVSLGSKINLFGNEGARQSLALLPFVKLPAAAQNIGNGVTEYSINAPYIVNLDNLWSMTAEPAASLLKDNNDTGLHGDYSFVVNLNRPVFINTVTAAVELASDFASGHQNTPRYTFDPSLQWLVTPTLQLDIGIYLGLNKAAADYNPYTGISYRY